MSASAPYGVPPTIIGTGSPSRRLNSRAVRAGSPTRPSLGGLAGEDLAVLAEHDHRRDLRGGRAEGADLAPRRRGDRRRRVRGAEVDAEGVPHAICHRCERNGVSRRRTARSGNWEFSLGRRAIEPESNGGHRCCRARGDGARHGGSGRHGRRARPRGPRRAAAHRRGRGRTGHRRSCASSASSSRARAPSSTACSGAACAPSTTTSRPRRSPSCATAKRRPSIVRRREGDQAVVEPIPVAELADG